MKQIRHTIIRVLGTCLVVACLEEKQSHARDSESSGHHHEAITSANIVSLLRKTKLLRARVRRSIAYAFAYSVASELCSAVASSVSESHIWTMFVELATAVLLERIHYRWTNSITGRVPHSRHAYRWQEHLLPTIVYALARKVVTELPTTVGTRFAAEGTTSTDAVAARDIVVLATAFLLRFFVLYPAWASLIAYETRRASQSPNCPRDQNGSYAHVLKTCYRKILLRLSALHLQAAGVMIVIETVAYTVVHFLLHTPAPPTSI